MPEAAEPGPEELVAEAAALGASAREDVARAQDLDALAALRARLTGKHGTVKALARRLAGLPKDLRPAAGAEVNRVAREVERALEDRRAELEAAAGLAESTFDPTFDPTLPGRCPPRGSLHPVTLVLDEIRGIFSRLGFDEVSGPEVEDAWHNFDALNIPPDHPARSPSDQFYVEGGRLLRSQTSTIQVRTMQAREPPLRVFAPGRVYRPETVDATHLYAFHQVEGLMVGEDVTFADLKACLLSFTHSMYGAEVALRFRPWYFPFTEVSAELDLRCPACAGSGRRRGERCSTCGGEGWMEVLGCGMVHPAVFRAVGYDPERWTGFAFGMGVERVAMRRWQLDDVRLMTDNDVRFLAQF
jgi:phenylalanyl-tRNA synthetase alpha chain